MGRDSLAMVFLKDKTLTRYFPDIRTQGVVFVIILFACPAPIYDKDQVLGVAVAGAGGAPRPGAAPFGAKLHGFERLSFIVSTTPEVPIIPTVLLLPC